MVTQTGDHNLPNGALAVGREERCSHMEYPFADPRLFAKTELRLRLSGAYTSKSPAVKLLLNSLHYI
jgi:hypothetical protein